MVAPSGGPQTISQIWYNIDRETGCGPAAAGQPPPRGRRNASWGKKKPRPTCELHQQPNIGSYMHLLYSSLLLLLLLSLTIIIIIIIIIVIIIIIIIIIISSSSSRTHTQNKP